MFLQGCSFFLDYMCFTNAGIPEQRHVITSPNTDTQTGGHAKRTRMHAYMHTRCGANVLHEALPQKQLGGAAKVTWEACMHVTPCRVT